jgi:phosphoglycerate dehydrogenase-like enzyme
MTAKRVLVWTGGSDFGLTDAVAAVRDVEVVRAADRAKAIERMADVDAFVTSVVPWNGEFAGALAASATLQWVQFLNAGVDNVERLGVPERVVVTNLGAVNSTVVAEHALLLLLALIRPLPMLASAQARGDWAHRAVVPALTTLRGKEIAVLGFGHIGRRFAALATALGARVTGIATRARVEPGGIRVASIAELPSVLAASDALMVALPLTTETEGLLDAAALRALKRGAYVVNVSRGRLVATEALLAALDEGALAGAALDVTDPEPLPSDHTLWRHPNVLVTPHVAGIGGGEIVRREMEELIVDNARRFAAGEPLRNVVTLHRV